MTGSLITGNTLFTDFTFALLEDSGYKISKLFLDFIE